jgi:hypothetical protein
MEASLLANEADIGPEKLASPRHRLLCPDASLCWPAEADNGVEEAYLSRMPRYLARWKLLSSRMKPTLIQRSFRRSVVAFPGAMEGDIGAEKALERGTIESAELAHVSQLQGELRESP